jgi:DNA-binding NtrC family response regulator
MEPRAVILCVDDEENPLILRKLVLQKAGYTVLTAKSAEEALKITSSRPVDLVLSDQLMPGVTGVQLAQQLKSQHPGLPVILLSGVNEIPTGADTADAFVSKLEGPDSLCKEIEALLNPPPQGLTSEAPSKPDGN